MKTHLLGILICFAAFTNELSAQTYCLTYKVARVGGALEVTLGLIANGSAFQLGASNLQFRYKTAVVSDPVLVSNVLTATGKYNGISLTKPTPMSFAGTGDSLVSLNFNFTGAFGTGFPISLAGTDIAVLRFQIKSGLSPLFRSYNNGSAGTVVYNDDPNQPLLLQTTGNCAIYDVLLPTESLSELNRLKVYPNPAHDFITLESVENQDFRIHNLMGQLMIKGKTQARTEIVVSHLPKGIYIIHIGRDSIKFVKP